MKKSLCLLLTLALLTVLQSCREKQTEQVSPQTGMEMQEGTQSETPQNESLESEQEVQLFSPEEGGNVPPSMSFRRATAEELRKMREEGVYLVESSVGNRAVCSWNDGQFGSIHCESPNYCAVIVCCGNEPTRKCIGCFDPNDNLQHAGACRPN